MSAGVLVQFVFYAIFVAGSAASLSQVWGEVQRAAGAAERLLELLEAQPAITAPPQPRLLPVPAAGSVNLEAVEFRYPSRPDEQALDGFSLSIEPGETLALVGPSGAGKSTVFKLLLRFYDPGSGCIRLDGLDLRHADPQAVRSRIGLVPQETVIFAANVRENIRYGRPEALDTEVAAAAPGPPSPTTSSGSCRTATTPSWARKARGSPSASASASPSPGRFSGTRR